MISYDFVNQIEDLPNNSEDILKDPDYVLYFLDNMFIIDHAPMFQIYAAVRVFNGACYCGYPWSIEVRRQLSQRVLPGVSIIIHNP